MPKGITRHFLFLSYVIMIVITLVEVSSQIYVRTLQPDLLERQEIENYQNFNMIKEWQANFKASPYFGYVTKHGNNYGFDSNESFPIKRNKKTYVIAIAGGSVANHFAHYISANDNYKDKLKTMIPFLKDKELQIMNLSVPGYRQPQQFFTISYFMDHIDLVIQLDGWNESWIRTANQFPADYPAFSEILYSDKLATKISEIKNDKFIIDTIKHNKILNKSHSLLLVRNILQKNVNQKSEDILNDDHYSFYEKNKTEEELKGISVSAWSKYIKMEQALLKIRNKKFFFFIQPNQYNDDSKTFSEQERKIAINQTGSYEKSANAFKNLRKEAEKLEVWDLVNVFKKVQDDIYTDDCCHVNKKGNQLIADEIFRIVSINFKQ